MNSLQFLSGAARAAGQFRDESRNGTRSRGSRHRFPGCPSDLPRARPPGRRHRSSTLERSRVFRFPDMPLFGPNDGPLYQLEEDAWPLGRKRCVPPMTDSTDREWDYLKGEGPSAPDARSLALPLKPGEGKPFKLGWVVRGKPGAPESAHVRDAREANDPRRDANARRRHDSIAHNRDRTGVNPITGEVVDETKARRTERALVRGPKSIPSRPAEATAWEERKWRSRETRRPVREDAIIREGLPVAPDERPTASDNFVPPEYRERRLVVTGERGRRRGRIGPPARERRAVRHRARDDAHERGVQRRGLPHGAREKRISRGTSDRTSCPRRKQPPGSHTAPPTTISGAAVSEAGVDGKCRRGAIDGAIDAERQRAKFLLHPAREIYFPKPASRRVLVRVLVRVCARYDTRFGNTRALAVSLTRRWFPPSRRWGAVLYSSCFRGRALRFVEGSPPPPRAGVRPRLIHLVRFGTHPERRRRASETRLRSFPRVPTRGTSEEVRVSLLHRHRQEDSRDARIRSRRCSTTCRRCLLRVAPRGRRERWRRRVSRRVGRRGVPPRSRRRTR